MPHTFWQRWLLVATLGVIVFGAVMFLLPSVTQAFYSLLIFGQDKLGFAPDALRYIDFAHGILGIVMIGWMAALIPIILVPFQRGERWSWWTIALSLGIWFAIDSGYSLAAGFAPNAGLNVVLALLFAVPLAATYRRFQAYAQL